jgi:ribosomal RNA-processing protein 7
VQPVKKQKSKELGNFYRFQMREKKRGRTFTLLLHLLVRRRCAHWWIMVYVELKSLRERFEEDRQIVDKLKKANKFKPE